MSRENLRKTFWCDVVTSYIKSRKVEIGGSDELPDKYVEVADILLEEFDKRFEKVEEHDPLNCGLDGMFGSYISGGLSGVGIKTRRDLFDFIRSHTDKADANGVFWDIKESKMSKVPKLGVLKMRNIAAWYVDTLRGVN
jgi:hypothetical protein